MAPSSLPSSPTSCNSDNTSSVSTSSVTTEMDHKAKLDELERKPRNELTEYELELLEERDFTTGPYSLLYAAVKNNLQVLVSLRDDKQLLGRVKAFDRHMNMVLVNVKIMLTRPKWKGQPEGGEEVEAESYAGKMFQRGDCIIMVVLIGK